MIVEWLPLRISADLSLVSGFLTWIIILAWLWRSGWRIQRRYFIEATQKPLTRNAIVWCAGIFGAFFFVGAQMRPGMPAVMTVAMIGALSAYVDACTHRLPNTYTAVMGIGVLAGTLVGMLISPMWQQRLIGCVIGMLIWTIPIAIRNRLPGGMGGGDVKLAPVLGAMVGSVGLEDRRRLGWHAEPRSHGTVDDWVRAGGHHRVGRRPRLAIGLCHWPHRGPVGTEWVRDGTMTR